MPQMAPLNWLTLLLFFTSIFLVFNMINFFTFNYFVKKTPYKETKIQYNWKW
uniref:ATP synthase complex subunit 8 n=1 Tax=Phaolus metallicus TaxID=2547844 RepID=A0A6H0N5U1_9CUCU|nr:ATP synthase F0 subunit 8 [Phaolus metallicus]